MTVPIKYPVALAAVFVWLGFVCAISFMEAWLKFRAPGITLPLGLGIGRLVFAALNKVEWILAITAKARESYDGKLCMKRYLYPIHQQRKFFPNYGTFRKSAIGANY